MPYPPHHGQGDQGDAVESVDRRLWHGAAQICLRSSQLRRPVRSRAALNGAGGGELAGPPIAARLRKWSPSPIAPAGFVCESRQLFVARRRKLANRGGDSPLTRREPGLG